MVEETQEMSKVEVEQFPEEKGDVEGKRNGAELHCLVRHVRKHDVSGEIPRSGEWRSFESNKNHKLRAQEQISERYQLGIRYSILQPTATTSGGNVHL